jgi:hypothetical protein
VSNTEYIAHGYRIYTWRQGAVHNTSHIHLSCAPSTPYTSHTPRLHYLDHLHHIYPISPGADCIPLRHTDLRFTSRLSSATITIHFVLASIARYLLSNRRFLHIVGRLPHGHVTSFLAAGADVGSLRLASGSGMQTSLICKQ